MAKRAKLDEEDNGLERVIAAFDHEGDEGSEDGSVSGHSSVPSDMVSWYWNRIMGLSLTT